MLRGIGRNQITMKTQTYTSQTFLPAKMSSGEKAKLNDRLFHVHSQIFTGLSEQEFKACVLERDNYLTRIHIYTDRQGKDVGYLFFLAFETGPGRKDPLVTRFKVGLLPEARKNNLTFAKMVQDAVRFRLRHPFRSIYLLNPCSHPATYLLGAKRIPEVWPHPDRKTPAHILSLMEQLVKRLDIEPTEGGDVFSCKSLVKVKESKAFRKSTWDREDVFTQYFLQKNPNYDQGNSLLMLIPYSYHNVFMGLFRSLNRKIQKALKVGLPANAPEEQIKIQTF